PTPHELTETEKAAIYEASQPGKSGEQGSRFFSLSLPGRPPIFIKRCNDDVFAEASTQVFFHMLAKTDGSTPRVPRVLDAFGTPEGDYFLVMEKIEAKTLESCNRENAVQLAADAVAWLQEQLPSVPDTMFGRISSSVAPVWHPFFKDHQAGSGFADADGLATYISNV
ncbi:hypothetical protein FRC11_011496, partial [Ceratobasidium sp. 423]